MKKKNFLVKRLARNVQVMNQDLRREFGLNPSADREMTTLEKKVSPQFYGMLIQQLLGFHADMQLEMAENLVLLISTSPTRRGVLPWISSWTCATPGSPQSKAS